LNARTFIYQNCTATDAHDSDSLTAWAVSLTGKGAARNSGAAMPAQLSGAGAKAPKVTLLASMAWDACSARRWALSDSAPALAGCLSKGCNPLALVM